MTHDIFLRQDDILAKCSENVNILHNFLQTIDTTESFVARKKCRETRRKLLPMFLPCHPDWRLTYRTLFAVLISRWENLLQKLLENVNNSKVFESLKDESKHLRDITAGLEETIQAAITDTDLQTQMTKLKVNIFWSYLITNFDRGPPSTELRIVQILSRYYLRGTIMWHTNRRKPGHRTHAQWSGPD